METRQRILDAAAQVMRAEGLARTTTKEIARAAGCSEALLYKHFADKQEIFVRVLMEQLPAAAVDTDLVGRATVAENLRVIVTRLLVFYTRSFPMAASIFSSPELLAAHRESMDERGAGPRFPSSSLQAYLDAEVEAGRVPRTVDTETVARTLTGAALHEAFLTAFAGGTEPEDIDGLARRIVDVVLPALS